MLTYQEAKGIIINKYNMYKIECNDQEYSITIYSPFCDMHVLITFDSKNTVVFFGKEDIYEGAPGDYIFEIVNECIMNRVFVVIKRNMKGKWRATKFFYDDMNPDENDIDDFYKLYDKITSTSLKNPINRFFSEYTGLFEIYSWKTHEIIKR